MTRRDNAIGRYQRAGQAALESMRKRGVSPQGHPLWTEREDRILRVYAPDMEKMREKLPHRSVDAIRHRTQKLNLISVRPWTNREIVTLQRLFRSASLDDLFDALPHRTYAAMKIKARTLGLSRPKRRKVVGHPLLDELRAYCRKRGVTLRDLDAWMGTGTYFTFSGCRKIRPIQLRVLEAIKLMGGRVSITWGH